MNERQLNVPRLELQAAVLGCRMKSAIVQKTKCKSKAVYLWKDSKIVINYIKTKQQILESLLLISSTRFSS